MIIDRLENAARYAALHPGFPAAFEFLKRAKVAELAAGRHEVDGDRLYAMVIRGPGRGRGGAKLEAHRNYIDIQYVASGTDEMGWKLASECQQSEGGYDAGKDNEHFGDEPVIWFAVPAGMFAAFFPEDAHAPMGGEGEQEKIVMKVAVAWEG